MVLFYDTFHRRPRMAAMFSALMRARRTHDDLLPNPAILQQLQTAGVRWRERMLTPLVVTRLFLVQILFGNAAITRLRQLSGMNFAPSSYCEARLRLPLCLLRCLLRWTVDRARRCGRQVWMGARVYVVDCSTFSMPDTPSLRKQFGLPKAKGQRGKGCQQGVSYPVAKIMVLMDLVSGCVTRLIPGPLYRHEASNVIRVHRQLRKGDILLGDRAFCSFVHTALLKGRGVFACFRLHQRRKSVARGRETWKRPAQCPKWMNRRQFLTLPAELTVRIVRHTLRQKGYRTADIAIATTLLDEQLWPDEKIVELYGYRWNVETCFDHLKTTMKMSVLKCQSVAGVYRELMYLIVYNLIRLTMLQFALAEQLPADRVSFIDTMRYLSMRAIGLSGVEELLVNPYRPGRRQPRVIRRRMKEYDLLTQPRAVRIARENQG
jgi:hypothetical protein